MPNFLKGFRRFVEEKDQFVSTIKKQLDVPKKVWLGMPISLSNVKLGGHMITDPTIFYVTDFDDVSVTLTNVPKPGHEHDDDYEEDDPDDEIDLDKDTIRGHIEVTIDRDDFYKLQEPQGMTQGGGMGMGGPI